MYEITYNDIEIFEIYQHNQKAHFDGFYDFTFEDRFIVYHRKRKNNVQYYVLDKETSLTSTISQENKKKIFMREEYELLIPSIIHAIKYTGVNYKYKSTSDNPYETIDKIFRVILPAKGYAVREEQIKLSKTMLKGFLEKQVAICEAEVGTGKTFAYLVAGLIAKQYYEKVYNDSKPVTIATSTIELQKTLIEEEIPKLSKILYEYGIIDKPLEAVLRKGKEHYYCEHRCKQLHHEMLKHQEKYGHQAEILEMVTQLPFGIDLDRYEINNSVKKRICVANSCSKCSVNDQCKYKRMMEENEQKRFVDFQVTNHNLYLLNQKQVYLKTTPLLHESNFVVVDEGHKLKDAATDVFGEKIRKSDVRTYIMDVRYLLKQDNDKYKPYQELIKSLITVTDELFASLELVAIFDDDNAYALLDLNRYHKDKICEMRFLIDGIELLNKGNYTPTKMSGPMLISQLKTFENLKYRVTWLEIDENREMVFCNAPTCVNTLLHRVVWDSNSNYVLTSGTMSDGIDFEYFKKENGIDKIPERLLIESRTESPFDYGLNTRLYMPSSRILPDNSNELYKTHVANTIKEIIEATNGHTAILFTSYRVLTEVYKMLKDDLSQYELFYMRRGDKTTIQRFKKSKNGILFASGSMWEGIDCVGDVLSSVIIVRLPFPMRNALSEKKMESYTSVRAFIDECCIPDMLIKLRQGIGRLIRSETDSGVISILDPRVYFDSYNKKISETISKYPQVSSLDDIESFMREIKSKEYFEN